MKIFVRAEYRGIIKFRKRETVRKTSCSLGRRALAIVLRYYCRTARKNEKKKRERKRKREIEKKEKRGENVKISKPPIFRPVVT